MCTERVTQNVTSFAFVKAAEVRHQESRLLKQCLAFLKKKSKAQIILYFFSFFPSIFPQLKVGNYKYNSAKSYCPVAVAGYSGYSVFPVAVRSHHTDKMQDTEPYTVEAFKQQIIPPLTNHMRLPKTVPQLHSQAKCILHFQKLF